MAMNNDQIINLIHQLEGLLFHDDVLIENDSHPLLHLRNQLQEIDQKFELTTIAEQQNLISILHQFEINCFCHFIKQYSARIPSSILTALFDFLRFQIYINMRMNSYLSDYYFHFSLTYLISNSTIDYLIDQNKEISSNIEEYFLYFFSSIGSRSIYTKGNFSYSIFISRKNIPTFFQLNSSTERLLQAFITYLNHSQHYQSSISILKWLVNMTNIYGFIPYFVKTDYPNAVLQWISTKQDLSLRSWFLILNLLHNLARHRMGVKALNKLKAIDILKQWKEDHLSQLSTNENEKDILVAYYLIYAVLLEPKELKKEKMSNIQTVLDYILDRTIQAFDSSDLCFGPYNVCEYLSGLAKLVVNDTILIYIFSREHIYELFIEKFLLFNTICETTPLNTIICSSLYTIFWSISFLSEYNIKLKSNEKFLSFVQQAAITQSNDEHILIMKRAAKGILFNLDCIQMDIEPIEDRNPDQQIKIMISYAHKDTTFCKKLVTNLQEHFLGDIWVDFNKLFHPYEDDWEEIAKAITQCDVILMIVTANYCSSKSCRREVIHADKRNKRMIPIYQGKDYIPEDWFEIRVGSATWVRFGDKKNDQEVMDTLLGLINIQDKIKQNHHEVIQSNLHNEQLITDIPSMVDLPLNPIAFHTVSISPIEQWRREEIKYWFEENHLSDHLLNTFDFLDGSQLLTYAKLIINSPLRIDEEYERLRNQIGKDIFHLDEYARLLNSLKKLVHQSETKPALCIIL